MTLELVGPIAFVLQWNTITTGHYGVNETHKRRTLSVPQKILHQEIPVYVGCKVKYQL